LPLTVLMARLPVRRRRAGGLSGAAD